MSKVNLEDELDRLFPKGECKERGAALVLYAMAKILIKQEKDSIVQDLKDYLLREHEHLGSKKRPYVDSLKLEEYIQTRWQDTVEE